MPARLALTGSTTGLDIPSQLRIIQCAAHAGCDDDVFVSLEQRMKILGAYISDTPETSSDSFESKPVGNLVEEFDLATFSKLRKVYESNRRAVSDDARMFEILKEAFNSP